MEVVTIWIPVYWLSGAIKAITAVSILTALALPHYIPQTLRMVSAVLVSADRKRDLEVSNSALLSEVASRRQAEQEVRRLNKKLDRRVQERTNELATMDSTLAATIDELKRSEERFQELGGDSFRLIVNSIPQLAWIANPKGGIYWYNQRWYEYTGTSPGQLTDWEWETLHHHEFLPTVLERWRRSLAMEEPFEMEFPLRGADGRFRTFMTRVLPVRDGEGCVACWVSLVCYLSGRVNT